MANHLVNPDMSTHMKQKLFFALFFNFTLIFDYSLDLYMGYYAVFASKLMYSEHITIKSKHKIPTKHC